MLTTRLWMGFLLILLAAGLLFLDQWLAPWFPFLLAVSLLAAHAAGAELVAMLRAGGQEIGPRPWLVHLGITAILLAGWPAHVGLLGTPLAWILGTAVGFFLLVFLMEAALFVAPGGAVVRIGLTWLAVCYIPLLAGFLLQLRWLPGWHGPLAVGLGIFVPKSCDIGAYFSGRFLGRHRMTPVLSPKKTWEGAAGGLVLAMLAAVGINAIGSLTAAGPLLDELAAAGFGLVVGAAGMVGDLMESLIKRDCQQKDASAIMPGFGGILDVLDSILFSAPVSYWWLVGL